MALENYYIEKISAKAARPFIKYWHYSHYADIQHRYAFGLFRPGKFFPEMIGAMIYSPPAGPSAAEHYLPDEPENCIELRRLCCIDDTPKNAESFFISRTIKWLKKYTTIKLILSYADPEFGHEGTIYKASNFEMVGMSGGATVLMVDGKKYHPRTLNQKLRPYGREIKERWKNDDPDVNMIKTAPKYVYLYRIERK